MKTVQIKKEKRIDVVFDKSIAIQQYGKGNDYPQSVMEILSASVTGLSCFDTYRKFTYGKGFRDEVLYSLEANAKGETWDKILENAASDYCNFGGLAMLINYNLNGAISDVQNIPFEMCRYSTLEEGKVKSIKVHPDWGKRNTVNIPFKKDDIKTYPVFNPDNVLNEIKEVGGINNYEGQIFYFSNKGFGVYPLPIFDPALTDMSTEEGLTNVTYRNVRNNFFPSGALVEIAPSDQTEEQSNITAENLKGIQGDEKAGKMLYLQVENREEIPEFIPFKTINYDKEFTVTSEKVKDSIGRCFSQPAILRGEDIGAGFGADLIVNAYNYYNTFTTNERYTLEMIFAELMIYANINASTEIIPLTFNVDRSLSDRLGDKFDKFMEILDSERTNKVVLLSKLFGIDETEIQELL